MWEYLKGMVVLLIVSPSDPDNKVVGIRSKIWCLLNGTQTITINLDCKQFKQWTASKKLISAVAVLPSGCRRSNDDGDKRKVSTFTVKCVSGGRDDAPQDCSFFSSLLLTTRKHSVCLAKYICLKKMSVSACLLRLVYLAHTLCAHVSPAVAVHHKQQNIYVRTHMHVWRLKQGGNKTRTKQT